MPSGYLFTFPLMKIRGVEINITKRDVERAVASLKVERGVSSYYVLVDGKEIPVKRALYGVLKERNINVGLRDFNTRDAVRILKRLGFPVIRKSGGDILKFAGAIKGGYGFDAQREKVATGYY